jgi:TonB family protein
VTKPELRACGALAAFFTVGIALAAGPLSAVDFRRSYTQREDGRLEQIRIIDSSPSGVFDAAALDAVRQWRARPRVVNGQPVRLTDQRSTVRFCLPSAPSDPKLQPLR